MKIYQTILSQFGTVALFFLIFIFAGNTARVLAHGDEDHGDEKPKTTASDKGTVLHTSRLGGFEVTLKHPLFVPDTATSARLFITKFETNEPVANANAAIEIKDSNGSVVQAAVEKTETAGSYTVKFPALPQGTYTIRASLTYDGETDAATFSGVEIAPASIASAENGSMSWARTLLISLVFLIVLALFGGLIYFVLRFSEGEPAKNETVSA